MKLMEIKEYNSFEYLGNIILPHGLRLDKVADIVKLENYKDYKPGCIVDGEFTLSKTFIKSLEGSPYKVTGNFNLRETSELKSLTGGPVIVEGNYQVSGSSIESFDGLAKEIHGNLTIRFLDNIKNVKGLWGKKIFHIVGGAGDSDHDDINDALGIMIDHIKKGTKNYMEVMKDARAAGVESFFK